MRTHEKIALYDHAKSINASINEMKKYFSEKQLKSSIKMAIQMKNINDELDKAITTDLLAKEKIKKLILEKKEGGY